MCEQIGFKPTSVCANLASEDPQSLNEVHKSSEWPEWEKSMQIELQQLKVDSKVLSPGRGDVSFRVDSDAGVVTLVGIEQCQAHCSIQSIVVSELH